MPFKYFLLLFRSLVVNVVKLTVTFNKSIKVTISSIIEHYESQTKFAENEAKSDAKFIPEHDYDSAFYFIIPKAKTN